MNMVSMKMAKEEKDEQPGMASPSVSGPDYPYGLCIELNDDSLEKLGYKTPPSVGQEFTLTARVKVTASRSQEVDGENESSCSLQITEAGLGTAAAKDAKAERLYPSK